MTTTMEATRLAEGTGWHVWDLVCSAGPQDRAFEERHDTVAISAVVGGTFVYRAAEGTALLAPGALLLGNHGRCYECGHEHGRGDRCISFHFTPDYWEEIAAAVPGVRGSAFAVPSLPPAAALLPLTAALEAARESGRPALEEIALDLAGTALRLAAGTALRPHTASQRDQRRISDAVRRIERTAHDLEDDRPSLGALAREAGMSPYHFLRTFRGLVGMTPHQYVLRLRLNRAAVRLRTTGAPVTDIALAAGFNDLSTFGRRFRRIMGASPAAYRRNAAR